MARLPQPGGDEGEWGQILNDFLAQAHNPDGSHKPIDSSDVTGLAPVATSGSYGDLEHKPAIPSTAADVGAVAAAGLDSATADLVGDDSSNTAGALKAAFAAIDEVSPAVQEYVNSTIIDNDAIQNLAAETGYVWAVVDMAGRRALGIRTDGTVDIVKVALPSGSVTSEALGPDIALPQTVDMEAYGYVAAWVDQSDRIAMWLDRAGKLGFYGLTQSTLDYIAQAVGVNTTVSPAKYTTPNDGASLGITSGPDIVCWGDSLTAGAGSNGNPYSSVLQTLVPAGVTVRNAGVGGETSVTIAARSGATPFLLLPDNGQIPATTDPVTVAISLINDQQPRPLLQGGGGSDFQGTLAGVPGKLALVQPSGSSATWQDDDYYTFTRLTAGTAVAVDRPTPFRTDYSEDRRGDIVILWLGQNGPSDQRAIADDQAIIQHLSALNKRFLVLSRPTTTDAQDAAYHDAFGRRFIAIRQYLVQYGLQDAGITPTAQDTTDIANGTVPTSLRSDSVHGTAAYYQIVAQQVAGRLKELGWI